MPSPNSLQGVAAGPVGQSPQDMDGDALPPRPAKRARVALACSRCKTRKQKVCVFEQKHGLNANL